MWFTLVLKTDVSLWHHSLVAGEVDSMEIPTPWLATIYFRIIFRRLRSMQSPLVSTRVAQLFSFCFMPEHFVACYFSYSSEQISIFSKPPKCIMQSPMLCFNKKHTFNYIWSCFCSCFRDYWCMTIIHYITMRPDEAVLKLSLSLVV